MRGYNRIAPSYNNKYNNKRPANAYEASGVTGTQHGMFYLKWTPSELATLRAGALYTEVDEDGWVQRELGIGEDGLVTHQLVPTDARPGWFGLARLSFAMLDSNVTKAEFESLWHAGAGRSSDG
ncbi:MAG TPA: hypothetical protein VGL98_05870 [Gammaproteobacteria bacterium]